MRPVWAALLLLAGCGQGTRPVNNAQESPNIVAPVPAPGPANNIVEAAPAAPDPAALAGLSPRQRRAYETGFADCRAGRYEPDPWPEAYRIGCAAANDR